MRIILFLIVVFFLPVALEYLWNWVGANGDLFAFVFAVVYYFAVIRVGKFANTKISF